MFLALAERQSARQEGNSKTACERGFDGPCRSFVSGQLDARPDDEPRLPFRKRVVARRHAAKSVQAEERVAERVEVKAPLDFESEAGSAFVVIPGGANTGECREPNVSPGVDVKPPGDLTRYDIAGDQVCAYFRENTSRNPLRANALEWHKHHQAHNSGPEHAKNAMAQA